MTKRKALGGLLIATPVMLLGAVLGIASGWKGLLLVFGAVGAGIGFGMMIVKGLDLWD